MTARTVVWLAGGWLVAAVLTAVFTGRCLALMHDEDDES